MVTSEASESETDRVFQALSDATRRDIVTRVMTTEQSISQLAQHYNMSFAAVHKHVAVLERASLVTKERRGREQIVRGRVETLRGASQLLNTYEEIWRHRANQMDALLSETQGKG
jgi:DNA-binding transcriptional ArsR family regulator